MTVGRSADQMTRARRRPRGAVRDGRIAAGLELARTGGPDAVVLPEATQMVGVVPPYRASGGDLRRLQTVSELRSPGALAEVRPVAAVSATDEMQDLRRSCRATRHMSKTGSRSL